MSRVFMAVFFALMGTEALAAGTAAVLYLRQPGWRDTEVGRHLAAYMGTLAGLYAVTIAAVFVRSAVMQVVLLASHVAFAAALWQRAWLVWKGQHDKGR